MMEMSWHLKEPPTLMQYAQLTSKSYSLTDSEGQVIDNKYVCSIMTMNTVSKKLMRSR